MEKALRIKEKREAIENEIGEIKQRNFEAMKEKCRVDVVKKGERMDFLGRLHKERLEALQEENILRAQEASKLLPEQINQTQRLAEGVLRLKNKEIQEQKNRQVLRAQNIELKELETQLKSTYAAKSAQVQLKEQEAARADEKYRENQAAVMRSRWYNDDAFDKYMEDKEYQKKMQYKKDLQDQLVNNELMRQQRMEESHRERKIVEQVSEILHNENVEMARQKREKIAHVQAEREAFFRAREIWKCKEKEALLDEFNRQAQIIVDKMTEEKNRATQKSDETNARDAMMERIARRMLDDELKKKERENIVNELLVEEEKKRAAKELEDIAVKKEIVKRELLDDMKRQKLLVAESKIRSVAVDAAFGKYLGEQYEAAVKKEKEKDEERRRKGRKYGEDLKAVCEEKRALYTEEILLRQELRRKEEEQELQRLKEVSLERSKMLNEHAKNLKGFLKPGTIRSEDYEYMKTRQCNPHANPE